MWATLLTFAPVGLVLALLAFGDHGGPRIEPSSASLTMVAIAAFALGPGAISLLGPLLWLLAVTVAVTVMTAIGLVRTQRHAAPH